MAQIRLEPLGQDVDDVVAADAVSRETVLVQITDLHLGPHGARPYGTDTAANLRAVARAVGRMRLDPAAVLLTGDLTDRGELASYEHLREIVTDELDPLGCPIMAVIGNHDRRDAFRRAYLGEANPDGDVPHHERLDIGEGETGVRILMCDSYLVDRVTGRLGDDQLAWLDGELGSADGRACVVGLHHPSVPRGVPQPDDYLLEDRAAFGDVLAAHEVAAVLCGHSHVPTAASFAGTLHAAAPASAYLSDPSDRAGGRAYEGSGFAICTVREGRALVNPYVLPVGAVDLTDD